MQKWQRRSQRRSLQGKGWSFRNRVLLFLLASLLLLILVALPLLSTTTTEPSPPSHLVRSTEQVERSIFKPKPVVASTTPATTVADTRGTKRQHARKRAIRAIPYVESTEELQYQQAHAAELAKLSEKDLLEPWQKEGTTPTATDDGSSSGNSNNNSLPLIYTTDTILRRMLKEKALVWTASHRSSAPTKVPLSNVDVVDGSLAIVPEKLQRGVLSDKHIDVISPSTSGCGTDTNNFNRKDNDDGTVSISIALCAMVRNRARLTVEWIQWYRILGVEHFFIYDDDSDDDEDLLNVYMRPFVDRGIVSLFNVSDVVAAQKTAQTTNAGQQQQQQQRRQYTAFGRRVGGPLLVLYEHCMRRWKDSATTKPTVQRAEASTITKKKWIGIVDPDEFLVLQSGVCLDGFIRQIVRRGATRMPDGKTIENHNSNKDTTKSIHYAVKAVSVPWLTVGHGGQLHDHNTRTQLERAGFAKGAPDGFSELFKSFVDVTEMNKTVSHMNTAHFVHMRDDQEKKKKKIFVTVFSDGQIVEPDASKGDGIMFMNTSHLTDANLLPAATTDIDNSSISSAAAYPRAVLLHFYCRSFASFLQRKLDGYSDVDVTRNVVAVDEIYSYWFKKFYRMGYNRGSFSNETLGLRHELLLKSLGF